MIYVKLVAIPRSDQSQIAKLQQSRLVLQAYLRRQLVTEGPPTRGKSRSRMIAWGAARTIST